MSKMIWPTTLGVLLALSACTSEAGKQPPAGDDTTSRSIEFSAVLTSASYGVNPDDAQTVEINFRPSAAPTFDFSKS